MFYVCKGFGVTMEVMNKWRKTILQTFMALFPVVQRTDRFIQWANRYPADKRYWLEYICCTVGVQPRPGLQTDITGRLFWPDSYRDSQHMSCRESTQPCPESCSWRHHRSTKKKKTQLIHLFDDPGKHSYDLKSQKSLVPPLSRSERHR